MELPPTEKEVCTEDETYNLLFELCKCINCYFLKLDSLFGGECKRLGGFIENGSGCEVFEPATPTIKAKKEELISSLNDYITTDGLPF